MGVLLSRVKNSSRLVVGVPLVNFGQNLSLKKIDRSRSHGGDDNLGVGSREVRGVSPYLPISLSPFQIIYLPISVSILGVEVGHESRLPVGRQGHGRGL